MRRWCLVFDLSRSSCTIDKTVFVRLKSLIRPRQKIGNVCCARIEYSGIGVDVFYVARPFEFKQKQKKNTARPTENVLLYGRT